MGYRMLAITTPRLARTRVHLGKVRTRKISLDHLVGADYDRWRNGEAERLGGQEIDHQLEFAGLFDRQNYIGVRG